MTDNNYISYIPAGRTSLVHRGNEDLQVQTEYAPRPYPRITTTVLNAGRVLHKIEKKLDEPIRSEEEQRRIQRVLQQQHADVTSLLGNKAAAAAPTPTPAPTPVPAPTHEPAQPVAAKSLTEKLTAIGGIKRVYRLDSDGNFIGDGSGEQFKKAFAPVFKHMHELLNVFVQLPGASGRREQGVYEIARDSLYMVSTGREFYFVVVGRVDRESNFEKSIREALKHDLLIP